MKKMVWIWLMMACLPFLAFAQSSDDLYFIPKKKTEKKEVTGIPAKVVVEKVEAPTTVYASPGSTVVVKDVDGNLRDVDEYNRRYTSRDNTFTMENDTLYIEEKPYNERGEWVNGFEGSESDYEYAMRIVRFRNPRYAIPVSSPLYWEVVYTLPSWDWNVYDDGLYAYAFPTYSNPLWWDWRYSYSWGWSSPWYHNRWYYSSWYGPHWHGSYWGGWHYPYHRPYHYPHYHHHHPYYAYGGVGGYWGGHGRYGSTAHRPGIHAGRYVNNYSRDKIVSQSNSRRSSTTVNRTGRNTNTSGVRQSSNRGTMQRTTGRVVTAKDGNASVRPQRSAGTSQREATVNGSGVRTTVRSNSMYSRPAQGQGSSYNRQSSTRSTVNRSSAARKNESVNSSRTSSRSSNSSSSYSRSSSRSSSGSSYSSGSSRSRSSMGGGGGVSRSSGGGSRGGGGRR